MPEPDASTTDEPEPSSNPNAATRPSGRGGSTETLRVVLALLPASSVTVNVMSTVPSVVNVIEVCGPTAVCPSVLDHS